MLAFGLALFPGVAAYANPGPTTAQPTSHPTSTASVSTNTRSPKAGHATPTHDAAKHADVKPMADTNTVTMSKDATVVGGGPLQPGGAIEYTLTVTCSGLKDGCVNQSITDVLPADLTVTSLPKSVPNQYDVTYDAASRTLTIDFVQTLVNPPGTVGLGDGGTMAINIGMQLPTDTQLTDGSAVKNTATTDADNAAPASDTVSTPVNIPRVVTPRTTKTWSPNSAIAQSREASTITLRSVNESSTSAQVHSLTVEDSTPATFEDFDLTGATLVALPKGADQAVLMVCTVAGSSCTDADYVAGQVATTPGALGLPPGVGVGDVTAVRVKFSNSHGAVLPGPDTSEGGSIELGVQLRDTVRSTGDPLSPTTTTAVNNCATSTAVDPVLGSVAGQQACAAFTIHPNLVDLGTSKTFFPDGNHNYKQDSGEHAVVGENSGVSAVMTGTNNSKFAIAEMTITEPSLTSVSQFSKLDVSDVRLTFPSGATNAVLSVSCRDGSKVPDRTFTANQASVPSGCPSGTAPESVSVKYTGSIAAGAAAVLGVTGNLNDTVTDSDVATGIRDCADFDASVTESGENGAAGNACATLPVQLPLVRGTGTKSASQTSVPPGQPIDFTLNLTNSGNVPMVNPGIADPRVDTEGHPVDTGNPFAVLQLTGVDAPASVGGAKVTVQVFDPTAGDWVAYQAGNAGLLARATGLRVQVDGQLAPTGRVRVVVHTTRRSGIADGLSFTNCAQTITTGGEVYPGMASYCSASMTTGPQQASAALGKTISPTTLVRPIPGMAPQRAQVNLALKNDGNMNLSRLVATDTDRGFFDAVDFTGVAGINMPPGANRVRLDACTSAASCASGDFVIGTPSAGTPGLPAGVTADAVLGLRVTFSNSAGGYRLTPGSNLPNSGTCKAASFCFTVSPRVTLRSTGEAVPDTINNTAHGGYESVLQPPGTLVDIPPSSASLQLTEGKPQLGFTKAPNSTVAPGAPAPFTLTTTNTGTANVPHLEVTDPIPDGLIFDDSWAGSTIDGQTVPYKVTVTDLPPGVTAPDPAFTAKVSGSQITQVTWDFGDWNLPPGAVVTIQFHTKLAPGVVAGQKITNEAGATSPVSGLTCRTATDADFQGGGYCTGTAVVTTQAGAAFNAQKWVAGTPELGWYNTTTDDYVSVGGGGCPSFTVSGVQYTAYPCIALVDPGDQFRYAVQIVNAGTETGTQMRVIDKFPVEGDTGVVLKNQPRDTEWSNRPTLASEPTLVGAPAGTTLTNSYTDGAVCADDLNLSAGAAQCPAGDWSAAFGASNTGAQMRLAFAPGLAPGAAVVMTFAMKTPSDVPEVHNPTIAWNSFGHSETTVRADGTVRALPPTEPLKVGVATTYGSLMLVKKIGENPDDLKVDDLDYVFHVECTIHPVGGDPATVLDKDYTVHADDPVPVTGIPGGAECKVYESDSRGGIPDHPESDPVTATIGRSGDGRAQTATITNDFPDAIVEVTKKVAGAPSDGPFTIALDCTFGGSPVPGFPKDITFDSAGTVPVSDIPAGSACRAEETENGGADSVAYDPVGPGDGSGDVVAKDGEPQQITVTNTFDSSTLDVVKKVDGDASKATGPFTVHVTCDTASGHAVIGFPQDVTFDRAGSHVLGDIPAGSSCSVVETADGGASSVVYDPAAAAGGHGSGTVTTSADAAATISVTNTFPPLTTPPTSPTGPPSSGSSTPTTPTGSPSTTPSGTGQPSPSSSNGATGPPIVTDGQRSPGAGLVGFGLLIVAGGAVAVGFGVRRRLRK